MNQNRNELVSYIHYTKHECKVHQTDETVCVLFIFNLKTLVFPKSLKTRWLIIKISKTVQTGANSTDSFFKHTTGISSSIHPYSYAIIYIIMYKKCNQLSLSPRFGINSIANSRQCFPTPVARPSVHCRKGSNRSDARPSCTPNNTHGSWISPHQWTKDPIWREMQRRGI